MGDEKGGEGAKVDGDGLHTRNFEWERRESNFRPEEFGVELGAVQHQTENESLVTAGLDSMHSMTEFDKAAESGEIDHERARKERQTQAQSRMSKKI